MNTINYEIYREDSPEPISIENIEKILFQMKNCVCKIYQNGNFALGFFCKFPFQDNNQMIYTLITNNHVLDENDTNNGNIIKCSIYGHKDL